ncbi:MAG: peptidylprolyl isomerase [Anaerolineales bacterium]|jgi:hypothetical protein
MAKSKPTKIISKKHLARLERERQQIAIITFVAIGVLVIVVGLIGYGILYDTVLQARQPIVKVNNDVMTTHEFQVWVRITRQNMINEYLQYYQLAQMFGSDPTTDPTITSLSSQLDDPSSIGNQVLQSAEDSFIIRQYAKTHGIVVSAKEIQDAMQGAFSYYPNGTPTPTLTATSFVYSTLSATQLALETLTPTPTIASSPTPTSGPTPTPTTYPTDTPAATAGPTSTATPLPTPFTLKAYQTQVKTSQTYYAKLGMTDTEFAQLFFEDGLYRQKVEVAVEAGFSHSQEQVWARQVVVADQATANKVRQLLASGSDWTTIAANYSTDSASKSQGGDLGWFGRGTMTAAPEAEAAAFSQAIGVIGQPVQSSDGWHIIQVLGHEVRPLTADQYSTARDQAFQTWLDTQLKSAKVTLYSYWTSRVPTEPTIQEAQATQTAQAIAPVNP